MTWLSARIAAPAAVFCCVCLHTPGAVAESSVKLEPAKKKTVAGFRMEGAAEIEIVFGDSQQYKKRVDHFYELLDAMTEARRSVSRHVQASLAALAAKRRGRCPEDDLAPHYYRARTDADRYRELGVELEIEYVAICRLDELGDTAGLTPDYRWRVNRVRQLYRTALIDYREMKAALADQLGREVAHRRCKAERLLERGERMEAVAEEIAVNPTKPYRRRKKAEKTVPVAASPVTFFVDNRGCDGKLRVYLDGAILGEVAADAKAAFQSLAGRHAMCLMPAGATATCGQKGTVRTAHIHDGWSISMHCTAKQGRK